MEPASHQDDPAGADQQQARGTRGVGVILDKNDAVRAFQQLRELIDHGSPAAEDVET
jgi:hypothetical protein